MVKIIKEEDFFNMINENPQETNSEENNNSKLEPQSLF